MTRIRTDNQKLRDSAHVSLVTINYKLALTQASEVQNTQIPHTNPWDFYCPHKKGIFL